MHNISSRLIEDSSDEDEGTTLFQSLESQKKWKDSHREFEVAGRAAISALEVQLKWCPDLGLEKLAHIEVQARDLYWKTLKTYASSSVVPIDHREFTFSFKDTEEERAKEENERLAIVGQYLKLRIIERVRHLEKAAKKPKTPKRKRKKQVKKLLPGTPF